MDDAPLLEVGQAKVETGVTVSLLLMTGGEGGLGRYAVAWGPTTEHVKFFMDGDVDEALAFAQQKLADLWHG